jgi:hypothetical protein
MKRILFACLVLASCKKSSNTTDPPPPPPPTPTVSPVLISKTYRLDTTLPHPRDTVSRSFFIYDAQNRIASGGTASFTPNGDTIGYYTFKCQYNGNDTIANQVFKSVKDYSPGYTGTRYDTSAYVYTNGKLSYDTTYSKDYQGYRSFQSHSYTYSPGFISRVEKNYPYSGSIIRKIAAFHPATTNGNITAQVDTTIYYTGATYNYTEGKQVSVTYLSNPNPLYNLSLPGLFGIIEDDDVLLLSESFQPKNLPSHLTMQRNFWGSSTGNSTVQVSYSYSFRNDGYPIKWKELFTTNTGQSEAIVIVLEYK